MSSGLSARPDPIWAASWPSSEAQMRLALALQRDRRGVDGPDQHQIPVHAPDVVGGQVQRVVGVVDPLTFRGEQLNEIARLIGYIWGGLVEC